MPSGFSEETAASREKRWLLLKNTAANKNSVRLCRDGWEKKAFCVGGKEKIRCEEFFNVEVRSDGRRIAYSANEDTIVFDTEIGKSFRITGFKRAERLPTVCNLNAAWEKDGVALSWEENGLKYAVYRGKDNEKDYRLIGVTSEGRFIDKEYNENAKALLTYKVVAYRGGKHSSRMQGAIAVVNPATELEKERYKLKFRMNNINLE